MLYKQENITLVDEVRTTGRGNRVWIEILKFLAVLTPINLIMVFAGEAIKAALFQNSVINEEISIIIKLYECYFGTDIPSRDQLIAHNRTIEEINEIIGADSLGYLRVERLKEIAGGLGICTGCFDEKYPMEPPREDIRGEYIK